uniref:Precorrin-6A synthase (Deacetylating) n=1 Tax=Tsukamurella soli TaxID=644556 RepID=A0ABP8K5D4_9ACTN
MRTALLIGIGAGDPTQVTVQAIEAMSAADAFFVLDKGATTGTLKGIRQEILDAYAPGARLVLVPDPPRDRDAADYVAAVDDWHDRRAAALAEAVTREVPDGGVAGFLVWGDPSLYDSTLRIVQRSPIPLQPRMIPGITSVQALTAAHAVLLNRVGEPIHITTGRRLAEDDGRNTVVMLDADCTFLRTARPDDEIYWGAYLGTEHEILLSGTVGAVGEEIARTRAAARAEHGWIMDVYLLRRPEDGEAQGG